MSAGAGAAAETGEGEYGMGAGAGEGGPLGVVASAFRGIRFGLSTIRDMVMVPAAAGTKRPPPSSSSSQLPKKPTEIRVFVAGFGRTGSASLARALEDLGYKPCWGPDVFRFADEVEAYTSGRITGGDLLDAMAAGGCDATGLDIFGWSLYRDAAARMAKNGVKMILTVRDPDAWADSVAGTVALHFAYFHRAPFRWLPLFRKINPYLRNMISVMTAGHPDDPTNLVHLRTGYLELESEVRRTVQEPAGSLLVYNVKEGWAPLCSFLEVEGGRCPTTPFPHVNDRVAMIATTYVLWIVTWIWPLLLVVPMWMLLRMHRKLLGASPQPGNDVKRPLTLEDYSAFQYMLARPSVAGAVTGRITEFVFYDEPNDESKPESDHAVLVRGTTNVLNYYYCCLFVLPSHILGMSRWVSARDCCSSSEMARKEDDDAKGETGDVLRHFKYEYYWGLLKVDTRHVRVAAAGDDDHFRLVEYFDCPISMKSLVRFFLFVGISAFFRLLQAYGIFGNISFFIVVGSSYLLLQAILVISGVR